MASVKLGSKTFDVNSEDIGADCCGVTDADCSALAARMKTGEISRVKTLQLVRFFPDFISVVFYFLNSTEPQFFCRPATRLATMVLVASQTRCEPTAPWRSCTLCVGSDFLILLHVLFQLYFCCVLFSELL
jgi:hypothetical protein